MTGEWEEIEVKSLPQAIKLATLWKDGAEVQYRHDDQDGIWRQYRSRKDRVESKTLGLSMLEGVCTGLYKDIEDVTSGKLAWRVRRCKHKLKKSY